MNIKEEIERLEKELAEKQTALICINGKKQELVKKIKIQRLFKGKGKPDYKYEEIPVIIVKDADAS